MRKYYYYTYKTNTYFGSNLCCSEDGSFPLSKSMDFLREQFGNEFTILFWHEISSQEYSSISKKYTY